MVGDGTSSENRIKWPSLYSAVVSPFEWRALDPTSGQSNDPSHVAFHVYKRGGHLTHGPPFHLNFFSEIFFFFSLHFKRKNPFLSSCHSQRSRSSGVRAPSKLWNQLLRRSPNPGDPFILFSTKTFCKSPDCACFEIIFHCSLGKYLL